MAEAEKPNDSCERVAAITEQLSGPESKFDFGQLYAESMQPILDSIRRSSAVLQKCIAPPVPEAVLKAWTEQQTALMASLRVKFPTSGVIDAFQTAEHQQRFAQMSNHRKRGHKGFSP